MTTCKMTLSDIKMHNWNKMNVHTATKVITVTMGIIEVSDRYIDRLTHVSVNYAKPKDTDLESILDNIFHSMYNIVLDGIADKIFISELMVTIAKLCVWVSHATGMSIADSVYTTLVFILNTVLSIDEEGRIKEERGYNYTAGKVIAEVWSEYNKRH